MKCRIARYAFWQRFANIASRANLRITARIPQQFCPRSRSQSPNIFNLDKTSLDFLRFDKLGHNIIVILCTLIIVNYVRWNPLVLNKMPRRMHLNFGQGHGHGHGMGKGNGHDRCNGYSYCCDHGGSHALWWPRQYPMAVAMATAMAMAKWS